MLLLNVFPMAIRVVFQVIKKTSVLYVMQEQ